MEISVDELIAMSDAELAQFILQHRTPEGNFVLPVNDWDKLSRDERNRLAERLNGQKPALAQSPRAQSRPLDLNQVDARLQEVASNNIPSQKRPLIARSGFSTPDFDRDGYEKDLETNAYNELIKDGGRPLYPINLLNDIFQNPEEHYELLRPWRLGWWKDFPWRHASLMDDPRQIFQRQLKRWQDFRRWQTDNRDLDNDEVEYMKLVERHKQRFNIYDKNTGESNRPWDKIMSDQMENDPSYFKFYWEYYQGPRDLQRRRCRESRGDKGFTVYVEAVIGRLARHGFTRSFQLKEDPKQQDKLTEWIEYLNFEYWWVDWYTASIERLKPARDKAWQELVDSKVLKPGETVDFMQTDACEMQLLRELNQAEEAWKRAVSKGEQVYESTQLDPNRLSIPKGERCRRLQAATREVLAARASQDFIKKRRDLIFAFCNDTRDYMKSEKDASRHSILVQWVLDQVPLVEAELAQSEATKVKPNETKMGTKRRLDPNDDDLGGRSLKQQKLNDGDLARSAATA
ncbi:hypothetical protein EV127DRAFT_405609 [Xylaria flabelliformis]|nr:hypothetical protein EV127DRAFT_405609 [Xylaria flabelliformis]